eukprot:COSAG02_NODE_15485_length_1166_cov_7.038425_1_plen_45_part_10
MTHESLRYALAARGGGGCAKIPSGSGRSAEAAAFISEVYPGKGSA